MPDAPPPVVDLRHLHFRWQAGGPEILAIEALAVAAGERVFLEGPSGSGKTTLLSLIAGVVRPRAGAVRVLGVDLAALSSSARDAFRGDHIGFVFQMFNLIPYLSLVENVLLPCRFAPGRRRRLATLARGAEDEARRLLGHLDLDIEALGRRPVTALSAGQQQRVAVARALIGRPELVICDEPTSALDTDTRSTFLDLLFREVAAAGATLLFVSHDRTLSRAFDRTVVLPEINGAGEVMGR